MEKPPYKIPSMRDIYATPLNGLVAVSTFSGCGGTCLGLRWAGVKVAWANEFISEAQNTYKANHKETFLNTDDIRRITGSQIREESGIGDRDIDLFEGSPPCAAFSMAGKREKSWGEVKKYSDTKQRVDDLFLQYIRLVSELKPRAFMAENVTGLARGAAKGFFKKILTDLANLGYCVKAAIVDSSLLGVPQKRERIFIVGIRNDVGVKPEFPKPFSYIYTVADAIYENVLETTKEERDFLNLERFAIWQTAKFLLPGQSPKKSLFNLIVPDANKPLPTYTATNCSPGSAAVTHPCGNRNLYRWEVRRLCGFPDDFILTGPISKQLERLGRSVMPPVAKAIGSVISRQLLSLENS